MDMYRTLFWSIASQFNPLERLLASSGWLLAGILVYFNVLPSISWQSRKTFPCLASWISCLLFSSDWPRPEYFSRLPCHWWGTDCLTKPRSNLLCAQKTASNATLFSIMGDRPTQSLWLALARTLSPDMRCALWCAVLDALTWCPILGGRYDHFHGIPKICINSPCPWGLLLPFFQQNIFSIMSSESWVAFISSCICTFVANLLTYRIPEINAQLFESRNPHLTSGVKIGIGLFNRDSEVVGPSNKSIKVPEWTLILHPKKYRSSSRTIHGIYKYTGPDPNPDTKSVQNSDDWVWKLRDPQDSKSQTDLSDPIGIIHIADFPWSHELLQSVVKSNFKAEKNGDNPGGVTVWSSSAWTIRVLHYLQEWYGKYTGFRLPCTTRRLHELIREKITVLKTMKHRRGKVPIVNLVDTGPYHAHHTGRSKNRGTHLWGYAALNDLFWPSFKFPTIVMPLMPHYATFSAHVNLRLCFVYAPFYYFSVWLSSWLASFLSCNSFFHSHIIHSIKFYWSRNCLESDLVTCCLSLFNVTTTGPQIYSLLDISSKPVQLRIDSF